MSTTKFNWRADQHVRLVHGDIVGFGRDGVWTARSNGNGTFQTPQSVLADLGFNSGWRVDQHPRFLADITGDGRVDLVGFGNDGVWTALSNGDGTFRNLQFVLADLGFNSGWRVDQHPRFLADITGDGRADLVGFGNDGVWTALSNGDGTFRNLQFVIAGFTDWRTDRHPRFLADITGDGRADIVGFGEGGLWTARSNGDGTFTYPGFAGDFGGVSSGWRVPQHPRLLVDLTGDGRADIVGFGIDGVWTALSNGNGTFQPPRFVLKDFGEQSNTPAAPTGLQVTLVTGNQATKGEIRLRWVDNSDNELGFYVRYRGKRSGFADDAGTITRSAGSTEAILSGLPGGFTYTISVSAYNESAESGRSNEVHATTPNFGETVTINLQRQPVVSGPVPYAGEYPPFGVVPAGRLLGVKIPQVSFVDFALAFLKSGHSSPECDNPSAVVVITEGQSMTPAQLKEIYGVSEPRFTSVAPIGFVACRRTNNPTGPWPDFVTIELNIIYDP